MHVQQTSGHTDDVICGTASNAGELFVSGSADATVRIWNLQSGKVSHLLPLKSSLTFPFSLCAGASNYGCVKEKQHHHSMVDEM